MAGLYRRTPGVGLDHLIWRGEIYDVDLGHPIGHEPAFVRPAMVVSSDVLNNSAADLVVVVPIGTTSYGLRSHVELEPGDSGLDHLSYARCDQIRVVSTDRIVTRRGIAAVEEIRAIDQALRFILDL
ncbi:MAG TPA: type II toxin-antitoxin system PemK/MazF family toxin [Acidimicrobiales bacterium]|nr:type II toxin-antitoxin system PemK/MazF family toxin [Acidimicrobiales bacterium]